ncbi:hypothetical protein ACWDV4_00105 [Micromonospora sp. NPDC003197]
MRDAATPPDDGPDAHHPTTPTPQQRAANIRANAAEVWERVQEWRDSPNWHGNETNQRRYQLTANAINALDAVPDPRTHAEVSALISAVRPILAEWRPSRPGPEQAIYAAIERLDHAATTDSTDQ